MQPINLEKFAYQLLIIVLYLLATDLSGKTTDTRKSIFDYMHYQEVLAVTLEADFATIDSTRKVPFESQGKLTFEDEQGISQTWDVKLKTRGHFRRMNCEMSPLKIDFKKKDLEAHGLAPFDDLKLVTHCVPDKNLAKTFLQKEYLAYKLYNELTEYSYRVQLLRITYIDINTGSKTKRWAFLIEDTAQLKARIGATETPEHLVNLPKEAFDGTVLKVASVFQYMIGNSDWSIKAARNIKYFRKNGKIIPVPYDFDFAGIVSANYAIPNPNYGLTSVKSRVFLGFPEDAQQLTSIKSYFKTKRKTLFQIIDRFQILDRDNRNIIIEYLNSFFATMNEINVGRRG